jgi:hypothetical protein
MSDELRAAAERLQRALHEDESSPFLDPESDGATRIREDALLLADACLAADPADDGEAVTKEWWESFGGWEFSPGTGLMVYRPPTEGGGLWPIDAHIVRDRTKLLFGGSLITGRATRGHVRRLLRALGVELPAPAAPTGSE